MVGFVALWECFPGCACGLSLVVIGSEVAIERLGPGETHACRLSFAFFLEIVILVFIYNKEKQNVA